MTNFDFEDYLRCIRVIYGYDVYWEFVNDNLIAIHVHSNNNVVIFEARSFTDGTHTLQAFLMGVDFKRYNESKDILRRNHNEHRSIKSSRNCT